LLSLFFFFFLSVFRLKPSFPITPFWLLQPIRATTHRKKPPSPAFFLSHHDGSQQARNSDNGGNGRYSGGPGRGDRLRAVATA